MFEGLHRCLTTYRRKIIQKLVQCLPSFQAVQQILEGDASPRNTGVPPSTLGSLVITLFRMALYALG